MQSTEIGELVKALVAAQSTIKAPKKAHTANAGTYSYNYADLADVIDCYREPLSKNGLAVAQTMRPENGHLILTTILLHVSGQWLSSDYPIAAYSKPQEQGSAITYARRYTVTAMLGIAAEDDDDGKAAQNGEKVAKAVGPPSGDAGAILDLAAAIQQTDGGMIEEIIAAESRYTRGDKVRFFTDPMAPGVTAGELNITRKKLETRLKKLTAKEPGVAEAAELFR